MQILKVVGYHHVGIFAKELIEARVELFYDYGYAQDQAPGWVLKPDDPEEGPSSSSSSSKKATIASFTIISATITSVTIGRPITSLDT